MSLIIAGNMVLCDVYYSILIKHKQTDTQSSMNREKRCGCVWKAVYLANLGKFLSIFKILSRRAWAAEVDWHFKFKLKVLTLFPPKKMTPLESVVTALRNIRPQPLSLRKRKLFIPPLSLQEVCVWYSKGTFKEESQWAVVHLNFTVLLIKTCKQLFLETKLLSGSTSDCLWSWIHNFGD